MTESFECHVCNMSVSFKPKKNAHYVHASCSKCSMKYVIRRVPREKHDIKDRWIPAAELWLDTVQNKETADAIGQTLFDTMAEQMQQARIVTAMYRRYLRDCQLLGIKACDVPNGHEAGYIGFAQYHPLSEEQVVETVKETENTKERKRLETLEAQKKAQSKLIL